MTRISTEPGEYAMWTLDDVYPPAVIQQLSLEYGLDPDRLAEVLEEVVIDFDDKAHFYYRLPIWHEAKAKALEVLPQLEAAEKLWARAPDRIKATIAEETFGEYSSDRLVQDLTRMIGALREVAEVAPRSRGNQGRSRKKGGVDLTPFKDLVRMLNALWLDEKGKPLGHEVEYDHYREHAGVTEKYAVPKSHGIKFLHACLGRLDDRVTVESCRTLVRAVKKRARR
jgi:hypothetical protein